MRFAVLECGSGGRTGSPFRSNFNGTLLETPATLQPMVVSIVVSNFQVVRVMGV